jgi:hypothetical protein
VANKIMTAAQEKRALSRLTARLSSRINQKGLQLKRPGFRFRKAPLFAPGAPVPPAYAPPVPYPAPIA